MYRIILYSFLFVLTSSCNDHLKIEKNQDPQGYADSQFVGSWKIVAASSDIAWDWDGNGTTEKDVYGTWSSCQKDNLFTFSGELANVPTTSPDNKKGVFKINCSVTKDGIWQIVVNSSGFYLVYIPDGLNSESEKIISMTTQQFQTTLDLTLPNGQNATLTTIWVRQ
jgi:hypothetical protein